MSSFRHHLVDIVRLPHFHINALLRFAQAGAFPAGLKRGVLKDAAGRRNILPLADAVRDAWRVGALSR